VTEDVKSGAKPVILGGLVALAIGVSAIAFLPQPEPVAIPEQAAVAPLADDPVVADPQPDVAVEAPAAPQPPTGPQFDTFRVESDGSMVIAGRAEPNQTVDIILGGQSLERVVADGSGSFVALPVAGPSDQPRRLSLLADPEGAAIASETSYIVAPIAAPVIVAEVEEPAEPAALPETTVAEAPPVIAPQVASPTVLEADAEGVRVVQGGAVAVTDDIALDAITYAPDGEVQLSGRASGDGAVQIYIDNEPVTASPVTEGGDWRIDLPDIDTGVYTLRIDEVDTEGGVVSRLETPFKREEPADVAAVLAEETSADGFEVAVKTVQPGATLWAIAEENLGSGIYYVEVFQANSDLIRNPDLIYPGQIFRIPEITR